MSQKPHKATSQSLTQTLDQLAQALVRAADAGDWTGLARLNAQVDQLLRRLDRLPPPAEGAMARLRDAHLAARRSAERDLDELGQRIETLRNNREGLKAYEQSGGME